jgi:hypothetical protein
VRFPGNAAYVLPSVTGTYNSRGGFLRGAGVEDIATALMEKHTGLTDIQFAITSCRGEAHAAMAKVLGGVPRRHSLQ